MEDNKDKRIAELEEQVHELERDLIHDPLTGLKTRAFFEEELGAYLKNLGDKDMGKRKEWFGFRNISVIFFDIDHFKKVNDEHGHATGDDALKAVAGVIQSALRTGDTAARWGGEEMVVSLLGANGKDAMAKAEEIRKEVEGMKMPGKTELKLTISAGVASAEKELALPELIKRADSALYEAKNGGRNKVTAYGSK